MMQKLPLLRWIGKDAENIREDKSGSIAGKGLSTPTKTGIPWFTYSSADVAKVLTALRWTSINYYHHAPSETSSCQRSVKMSTTRTAWNVKSSDVAKRAHNPIRQIVDKLKIDPSIQKSFISLSVGQ